jgi:hypothetical protein
MQRNLNNSNKSEILKHITNYLEQIINARSLTLEQ